MVLLGLFSRNECLAQSTKTTWNGTTPKNAVDATDNDEKTVFLYNVKTGKWLNRASWWGVSSVLSEVGLEFEVSSVSNETNKYTFKTKLLSQSKNNSGSSNYTQEDTYLTYMTQNANGQFVVDRSLDDKDTNDKEYPQKFEATAVSGQTNVYRLKAGDYWLTAGYTGNGNAIYDKSNAVTGTTAEPSDEAGYWMLVTLKERKQAFMNATADEKTTVGATFLIKDPDFARRSADISSWNGGTTALVYATNTNNEGAYANGLTYYVGVNGSNNAQDAYKWTGNLHGASADLNQTISPFKHGWYEVRCRAFSTTSTAAPVLYAKVGEATAENATNNSYATAAIQKLSSTDKPSTYAAANDLVNKSEDATDGTSSYPYEVVVRVYVPKSDNSDSSDNSDQSDTSDQSDEATTTKSYETCPALTFGVKTENGENTDWLCVDNFEMYYLGEGNNIVLLDETQESVDYINEQAEGKNSTIYLNRSLTANVWNSILLPFDMAANDITNVFGSGTIVSKYVGTKEGGDANTIYFEKVSSIEKGKLYLVKPTTGEPTNQVSVSSTKKKTSSDSSTEEAVLSFTENSSYYTIPNIVFGTASSTGNQFEATVKEDAKQLTTSDTQKYVMAGTYVKKVGSKDANGNYSGYPAPANSYMVIASDKTNHTGSTGVWTLRTKPTNSLGFRAWLQPSEETNKAASLTFIINGVEDETTAIDGLTADMLVRPATAQGIYTISGQRISGDASKLSSLPKGLYIVNGKKMVVK